MPEVAVICRRGNVALTVLGCIHSDFKSVNATTLGRYSSLSRRLQRVVFFSIEYWHRYGDSADSSDIPNSPSIYL